MIEEDIKAFKKRVFPSVYDIDAAITQLCQQYYSKGIQKGMEIIRYRVEGSIFDDFNDKEQIKEALEDI